MRSGVPLPDAPPSLADRPAFSADGVVFTVADLVRRTRLGGREARFKAVPADQRPTAPQVEEAFRRARGVLRGDQLEAWLATWEIPAEDFRRWTEDVGAGTTTASGWCALLCSGELDAVTAEVATAAAAACELGEPPVSGAAFDPTGWTERLLAHSTSDHELNAVIATHRLDWTVLHTVAVTAGQRSVAEELRHQVLADGSTLVAAGAAAGLTPQESSEPLVAVTPSSLRSSLAGARAGELVGPVAVADKWTLVQVVTRSEPTLDEPATRARAASAVRNEVIARALARHVVA